MTKRIELKVITRAKKEEVRKTGEDSYRVKVSVPPEKGRANERVIELFSREFGISGNKIRIIKGETSARKILEIND